MHRVTTMTTGRLLYHSCWGVSASLPVVRYKDVPQGVNF